MAMGIHSGRRGGRKTPMAEINVTPLVDVMLVLLIIFMVTAPLVVTGVPVDLPDSRAKGLDQSQKPVQVSMTADGKLYLDDEETTIDALPDQLSEVAARGPESPQIYLRADRSLDYGKVIQVMGELNHAGLNKIALVSTGSSGEQ